MNKEDLIDCGYSQEEFPSPTGVNYYEYKIMVLYVRRNSFRPQQGLTIMNKKKTTTPKRKTTPKSFRPQQGLTIMNLL